MMNALQEMVDRKINALKAQREYLGKREQYLALAELGSIDGLSAKEKAATVDHLKRVIMGYIMHAIQKGRWDSDHADCFFEAAVEALWGDEGTEQARALINELRGW